MALNLRVIIYENEVPIEHRPLGHGVSAACDHGRNGGRNTSLGDIRLTPGLRHLREIGKKCNSPHLYNEVKSLRTMTK